MSEIKSNPPEKKRTHKKQFCRCSNGDTVELLFNPKAAIKVFCTECMWWDENPANCTDKLCPLYCFRGKSLKCVKNDHMENKNEQSTT